MPNNVQEPRVIWRCQECIRETGPTQCSFAVYTTKQIEEDIKSKIRKSKQRHTTQIDLRILGTHDTSEGHITGLIQEISTNMELTIEHVIKRQITSVHPDGFCLFRALGKNHHIQPGEVARYMKNKCIHMITNKMKMALESNERWYTQWANKTKEWTELKSGVRSH